MKEKLAKSPKLKLALAIAVPVLVMVVTIAMIGASFAWFTDSPDVYIETISFSTAEAFSLNFTLDGSGDNMPYKGQTAIATDGHLITPTWAGSNSTDDKPYCFVKRVSIDSNGKSADISLMLDGASIYIYDRNEEDGSIKTDESGNPIILRRPNNYSGDQLDNLPYAFTWFFRESVAGSTPQNYVTKEEKKVMIDYKPTSSEVWYTPYGKLEFNETGVLTKVNDVDFASIDDLTAEERIIENFTTGGTAKFYDFYIVFAPQKLFYNELLKTDKTQLMTAEEVYADLNVTETVDGVSVVKSNVAIEHMFGSLEPTIKRMYYSGLEYMGATFSFSALLNVVRLDETAGA